MWIAKCDCGWNWNDRKELGARLAIYWHMLQQHRHGGHEYDDFHYTVEWNEKVLAQSELERPVRIGKHWLILLPLGAALLFAQQPAPRAKPQNVVLNWHESESVDSFRIYRGGHGTEGFLVAVQGNVLTYTDVKPQPNKTFCYVVSSVRQGVESAKSNEACVNT